MIPLETIAIFFSASVALGLAPGPDNIFVLTQSAFHGRALKPRPASASVLDPMEA